MLDKKELEEFLGKIRQKLSSFHLSALKFDEMEKKILNSIIKPEEGNGVFLIGGVTNRSVINVVSVTPIANETDDKGDEWIIYSVELEEGGKVFMTEGKGAVLSDEEAIRMSY